MFTALVVIPLWFIVMAKNLRVWNVSAVESAVFQLTCTYQARKPGVKVQIVDMAFSDAGVRDTVRTLKIGINTVIRTLKNSCQSE